ncbi:MAG: hypothetical protein ACHQU1_00330 [Gemmatimonadales bacterium]
MASRMLQNMARAAAFLAVGLAFASSADARPLPGVRPVRATRGFSLFAGSPTLIYQVNRINCGIVNNGTACLDLTGSPVAESGLWPAGSPDNYVFNSGLQIAAFIPGTKTATFPWPGDTVGAFFFDPRGDQHHGEGVTNIFNAGNSDDLANWPTAAGVNDTALYNSALIGRQTLSQQDLWFRIWDGNTTLATGRKHTMGLLVDERWLGWNFPSGNQDILYVIVRFINITSNQLSDYTNGLSPLGYSAQDINDVYAVAQNYRASSQAFYNVVLPDTGFWWTNVVASYAADPDEGDATHNFSTANLIFNSVINYKSDFREATWQFPPSIFGAPFAAAPGFFGLKYLATPGNLGITMSGNTTNGGQFPDAVGVPRLWRNLTGSLLPTDGTCSIPQPVARRQCFWASQSSDTRIFAASYSPANTIKPGQAATIVAALVWGAPVASLPAVAAGRGGNHGIPAYNIASFIGNENMTAPFGLDGSRLLADQDTIKYVDRAMGFINYANDPNGNGKIDPSEVSLVPRSFLDKENVAQAVFDNKFLLPFAPEAPQFFLVPGDGTVTIAWQPSSSETTGNPFFAVAASPLSTCPGGVGLCANSLYDPNFRKFDVEGYRIYRGRSRSEMQVIAAFDKSGTTFVDYTAAVFNASQGNHCAPELGVQTSCTDENGSAIVSVAHPTGYTTPASAIDTNTSARSNWPIVGDFVQIPPGGRTQLADGSIFVLSADTAVTGGGSGLPVLQDNGVPFGYVDRGVIDGVRYFYAVTAFMVNSVKSGPSSLESPLVTKTTTPRVGSGAETPGVAALTFTGRGVVLDQSAPVPSINAATGIFNGPMPPTNGINIGFAAFLPYVNSGSVAITIDSVIPGNDCSIFGHACVNGSYWVTVIRPDSTLKKQFPFLIQGTSGPSGSFVYQYPPIKFVQSLASRFGGDSTYTLSAQATLSWAAAWNLASPGRGAANSLGGAFNGPRWWAGTPNEALSNPNGNVCAVLSSAGCVDTVGNANASAAGIQGGHINGVLPGIQYLWAPEGYMTATNPIRDIEVLTSSVMRAADFKVFWSAATPGKVDSVIDVTHNVVVPFATNVRASWGILNDSSFTNTPAASTFDGNNNFLTFTDYACVDPIPALIGTCGSVPQATSAFLMNHALSNPMNFKSSTLGGVGGGQSLVTQGTTGNGFIFYLNGHFFVMQMTSTLAACCQNTVWNARFYSGNIAGAPGSFSFQPATRAAAVPGLSVAINFTGSSFNTAVSDTSLMRQIHTVPDPYYVTNSLEQTVNTKILRFVNLPAEAIIRIYSASGILVNVISHNDPGGSGEQVWDLRNRNQQFVASGVYFYHVEAPDGRTKVGRFTVVNYAQ